MKNDSDVVRYLLATLFLAGSFGLAETSSTSGAPSATGGSPSPSRPSVILTNPNNIQVFDNDFFKTTSEPPANQVTPKGRSYAEDPDYNTDTRQRALEKCESLKNRDFSKYQECYKKDMANARKGIQEGYDEVERKQSLPLKNVPNPLIEEQMRDPSSSQEEN
jgi:hypothetical protein